MPTRLGFQAELVSCGRVTWFSAWRIATAPYPSPIRSPQLFSAGTGSNCVQTTSSMSLFLCRYRAKGRTRQRAVLNPVFGGLAGMSIPSGLTTLTRHLCHGSEAAARHAKANSNRDKVPEESVAIDADYVALTEWMAGPPNAVACDFGSLVPACAAVGGRRRGESLSFRSWMAELVGIPRLLLTEGPKIRGHEARPVCVGVARPARRMLSRQRLRPESTECFGFVWLGCRIGCGSSVCDLWSQNCATRRERSGSDNTRVLGTLLVDER